MKKKYLAVLSVVLCMLIFAIPVLAYASPSADSKTDIDVYKAQKQYQTELQNELNKYYKEENIDLSSPNVKITVTVDSRNDLNAIKESYTKPVVLYSENIQINGGTVSKNGSVTPATITDTQQAGSSQVAYQGVVVTVAGRIDASTQTVNGYSYYAINWSRYWFDSTNTSVAYVTQVHTLTWQHGSPLTQGASSDPVYDDNNDYYSSSTNNYTDQRYYYPSTFSCVPSNYGFAITHYDFYFNFTSNATPFNAGWCSLH